jgi:tetratricopeptide (TPR) repeat protein
MSPESNLRIIALLLLFSIAFISPRMEVSAADNSPQNPEIQKHIDKGIQFGNGGDFEKAIAEFKEVLKLDPKNVHAYNNIGVAYFRIGNLDQAIAYYSKAIDLGIADANMYFFRGQMYGKYQQEDAKAIKDYTKAIELQPKFSRAYLNRALSYSMLKEHDKAIADYNKMVELRPADLKVIIDSRAEQYFEKGDYTKAWADVEKAKELGVNIDKQLIDKLQKASPRKQ